MALMDQLGYKQESTPKRRNHHSSLGDFSMTPYASTANQSPYNPRMQNRTGHGYQNPNQSNNFGGFSNNHSSMNMNMYNPNTQQHHHNSNNALNDMTAAYQNQNSQHQLNNNNNMNNQAQPQQNRYPISPGKYGIGGLGDVNNVNEDKNEKNSALNKKFNKLPRKSIRSSGLGFASPMPSKLESKQKINPLDISTNTNLPSPISKHGDNNFNETVLNSSLNLTAMPPQPPPPQNRMYINNHSRMSVNNNNNQNNDDMNVRNANAVTIFGFPETEVHFIHKKFTGYGTVIGSSWNHNVLNIVYENVLSSKRALAEHAKYIKHQHYKYMIGVNYTERTQKNDEDSTNHQNMSSNSKKSGKYMNYTEMYNSQYNNPNGNNSVYFANSNNIEKNIVHNGPTHIFWKVFNFITSGW